MQHVDELSESEDDSNIVSKTVYSLRVDDRLNLTVHSHPLNREDIESLRVNVPVQFEEWIDSKLCTPTEGYASMMHYCSSHKATVPIARMREILDINYCKEFVCIL